MVSFVSAEDRGRILEGSPWTFDNALIVTAKMDRRADLTMVSLENFEMWIRVRGLLPRFLNRARDGEESW